MPSPFPGMDPYLESPAFWPDFHSRFINYWCEAIADALPASYTALIGERLYLVEQPPVERKLIHADISVTRPDAPGAAAPGKQGPVATLEPVTLPLPILEEVSETYIQILHRPDRELVTVLELLSPANKEEPGRGAYLAKRSGLWRRQVHLVELDLLLSGQHPPLGQALPSGDYYYLLARAGRRDCQAYTWTLRQPLPTLPVPLKAPDADVLVDLGAVFATAYQRGRYGRALDYAAASAAPLRPDQRAWVATRVQAAPPTGGA